MNSTTRRASAWTGWVAFAACTLLVLGVLNLFQGFTALFSDGYFVTRSGELLVWNYNTWGVILLIFGGLQLLIGGGLLTGATWARVAGSVLVMLNIIGEIGFLAAHPVWSTIVVALDLVVLFALTVRWDAAQGYRGESVAEWQARDEEAYRTGTGAHRRPDRDETMP
ncbi:hypothetical protein B4N89_07645 [Embleya scabrispora]|uniref:DUF7144 domain-containing protein n=1 Tax=Embleya scabrispora TaxID=159449 RepID=A0A1T3NW04_9ACTN|nr:hypothetical protein [Embleya scabrispora]OPC80840.1 hypothetical protein B4N89_07645 [Embleya scabrispora]